MQVCEPIPSITFLEQTVKGSAVLGGQLGLEEIDKPVFFSGNGFPNNGLLYRGVGRQDNPLAGAELEQDAQEILWFRADTGGLEHDLVGLLALLRMDLSIAHVFQNNLTLVLKRARIEQP